MASTNKTTNYELSQFVETDRPAWLTDYNSDMRKIDSNLKEVSDIAGGASGSISALADRMSAAEGNITTNANDIDVLEARADSLEAQAQSTAGTIANIQTEQTAQNLGIEAATELGYNLARPYDSASTYAVGDYVLFQNTLYKCITAVSVGEAFDPAKWLAIKATDEIAAGGYTLPIASASQLGGVKVGDGLSIDPVSGLLSASGGNSIDISNLFTPSVSAAMYHPAYSSAGSNWSSMNNPTVTFNGFYHKTDDVNIILINGTISFDSVSQSSDLLCYYAINFTAIDNTIPRPSSNIRISNQNFSNDNIVYVWSTGNINFTTHKYHVLGSGQTSGNFPSDEFSICIIWND